MYQLINELGVLLPLLLFLVSITLYFKSLFEKPTTAPSVDPDVCRSERSDVVRTYASMPLDRLVPLYCRSGLKAESKILIAQELKNRGWRERTLKTGKTVLVEPQTFV
jgi:hypothetical protein